MEDFNPDHAINAWYGKKMQRVGSETSHKYPAKRARTNRKNRSGKSYFILFRKQQRQ